MENVLKTYHGSRHAGNQDRSRSLDPDRRRDGHVQRRIWEANVTLVFEGESVSSHPGLGLKP
jgi:hypothetical protein